MGRRFAGLILDFAGVLRSNMDVIDLFEVRERLSAGRFLRACSTRTRTSCPRSSIVGWIMEPKDLAVVGATSQVDRCS